MTRLAPRPDTTRAARSATDPCAGSTVGYAVFVGASYNASGTGLSTPTTIGAPLSGTLAVSSPCGSASGALTDGFAFAFDIPSYSKFFYSPAGEILRVPLSATAPRPDAFAVTIAGETRTQSEALHFGCYQTYGAACDRTPPDLVTAEIGISSFVEGSATGHTHAWPDTVACGTTTPLPITLTKADGTEGWVGPGVSQSYQLPGWQPTTPGAFVYDGARGGAFSVPYGDARAGAIAYEAPACETMTAPTGATVWVTGLPYGTLLSDHITVVLPPPDRFAVSADPDTLDAGNSAAVTTVAIGGARETYLDPETPVTLSVSPAGAGILAWSRPYNPGVEGTAITVPYSKWYGYYAAGARQGVSFYQTGPLPDEDLTVTITATGGGISGSGRIVLLGRLRLELEAAPDSVATGGTSTLTAALAGRGAAAFDPAATLTFALDSPSMGTLRRASTGETGTTLAGVPLAEARGGVAFVAAQRQPPPALARGGAMARGDSTAADSVWAAARVTATVDGRADLTDTARIAVGGTSGLSVTLVCTGSGAARVCTVRVDLPAGLCDTVATMQVAVRGARGTLVVASTGARIAVGEGGATVTVQTAEALAGGVTFEPDATGTIRIGTLTAGFGAPAFTCGGEPILPGEAAVASGPLPACSPGQARGVDAPQQCIPSDDGGSPVMRLLDQTEQVVSGGYVMVSKVRPDVSLPLTALSFSSGDGLSDPHTYRPEVLGLPATIDPNAVRFQVTVLRNGSPVSIPLSGIEGTPSVTSATFEVVCQISVAGGKTCRGDKYVRFVSNSRPAYLAGHARSCTSNSPGLCYDDEVGDFQTIRVQLGDIVQWKLVPATGTPFPAGYSYASEQYSVGADGRRLLDPDGPAGSPPDLTYLNDVSRTVPTRFTDMSGTGGTVNPAGTVHQMNQTWAQASVDFQVTHAASVSDLSTTVEFSSDEPDQAGLPVFMSNGTIEVSLDDGSRESFEVFKNRSVRDKIDEIAEWLTSRGQQVAVVTQTYSRPTTGGAPIGPTSTHTVLITNRSSQTIHYTIGSSVKYRVREASYGTLQRIEFGEDLEYSMMTRFHILALSMGDLDPSTLDVFVIPDAAIRAFPVQGGDLVGRAFPFGNYRDSFPGLASSVVVSHYAADGVDARASTGLRADLPFTAAHEAGHVVFDGIYPGSTEPDGHDPSMQNLMGVLTSTAPTQDLSLSARRRLTAAQQVDARRSRPSLLGPFRGGAYRASGSEAPASADIGEAPVQIAP